MSIMAENGKKRATGGKVLVVGLCCLDLVNYVDKFPEEDSDTRVMEQRTCLGGNAANNVTVLAQLCGREGCELWAALPEGREEEDNAEKLDRLIYQAQISVRRSVRRPNTEVPVSTVIINRSSGSRTILHYRGSLPELTFDEFVATFVSSPNEESLLFSKFGWIHFEGRNFDQVRLMMDFVCAHRPSSVFPQISVELEKLRPSPCLEQLIPLADLIFVSKDFANSKSWMSPEATIDGIQHNFGVSNTPVICTWGDKGAAARLSHSAPLLVQPPFPLRAPVIDTLGAGDCFIGTALHYLNRGEALEKVLAEAVRMAGRKCTRKGLIGLVGDEGRRG